MPLKNCPKSLFTNRTIEVQEAASEFNGLAIHRLVTANSAGSQVPFRMLIEQLQENYRGMAVNDPRDSPKESIKKQYEQIKWYMDNQHYFQAITLIREWLVSLHYLEWKCTPSGDSWLQRDDHRRPVEMHLITVIPMPPIQMRVFRLFGEHVPISGTILLIVE